MLSALQPYCCAWACRGGPEQPHQEPERETGVLLAAVSTFIPISGSAFGEDGACYSITQHSWHCAVLCHLCLMSSCRGSTRADSCCNAAGAYKPGQPYAAEASEAVLHEFKAAGVPGGRSVAEQALPEVVSARTWEHAGVPRHSPWEAGKPGWSTAAAASMAAESMLVPQ